MRAPVRLALSLVSMCLGSMSRADSSVPLVAVEAPVPVLHADAPEPEPEAAPSHVGVELGAGVPSGASAQVLIAPWRALRLQAGGAHDAVGPGVLGGITVAPFDAWFAPVLSVTAGRMFESDGTAQVRRYVELTPSQQQLTRRLGYDFVSAELGVELGWAGRCVFAVHGGVAGVRGTLHDVGPALGLSPSQLQLSDVNVRAVIPSARLGLIFFI